MKSVPKTQGLSRNPSSAKLSVCIACVLLLIGANIASGADKLSDQPAAKSEVTNKVENFKQPTTFAELLALPPAQLEKVDIAVLNLLCAEGLHGSDDIDLKLLLGRLEALAEHVAQETKRNQHLFDEHPAKFKNSVPYFRMAMLATVLVQDLRIQYNPEREKQLENGHKLKSPEDEDKFFSDSKDVFLHGLLDGKHYGTCASMPFLYVAVARRLGYPVTLATTASHFYVRYEEGNGKHLNVEATEHRAFITPSDDEYKNPWDLKVSAEEISGLGHLRPLSNKEILGHSLLTRATVLRSMKQHDKQAELWATAKKYLPDTPMWGGIAHDMRRHALWDEVSSLHIPRGAGYAYFQDRKVRLHFLILRSADTAAVEKTVKDFVKELAEYVKGFVEPRDNELIEQPREPQQQLVLRYTAPSGKQVKIPADFLPPFERGAIPAPLGARVAEKKLEDEDSILTEFWKFYDEMNLTKQQARHQRMVQRGTGPVLIARERVPQECWDSIPPQLQLRLGGVHDEDEIVKEMWAFQREHAMRQEAEQRQERETAREQAMRALRQNGISPPPRRGYQPQPLPGEVSAFNKRESKLPEMFWEWVSPEAERRLSAGDVWMLQQHVKNLQVSKAGKEMREQMREAETPKLMHFELVPSSLLPRDAGAQEITPTRPLTPQPPQPITPSPNQKGKP